MQKSLNTQKNFARFEKNLGIQNFCFKFHSFAWNDLVICFFAQFASLLKYIMLKPGKSHTQSSSWFKGITLIGGPLGRAAEMSGLWNFSVRVQSWSDKIESDPVLIRKIFENLQSDTVLIRQCKIRYFYFVSWGKRTTGAILPLLKYDWLKAKKFQQCFCLIRQNRCSLLTLSKFDKCLFGIRGKLYLVKHCWSYFAPMKIWLIGLVKWQGRHNWISLRSL